MAEPLIGQALPRVEDERLLRGAGRFVDDLHPTGCAEAAVLRSPHAHARIVALDCSAARSAPGVIAVIDGAEAAAHLPAMVFEVARMVPQAIRDSIGADVRVHPIPVLAHERVTYVGQAVAMVVAEDRYLAEDALELIDVEYAPLPAVVDPEEALAEHAPLVEPSWPDNVAIAFRCRKGDADAAFERADIVIEETFRSHRQVASPIETRGTLALIEADGTLRVWGSTQTPHQLRDFLAGSFGLPPDAVHVTAADVGGGFGPKGVIYPEDVLVVHAARRTGRPVKWIEDRAEHLAATTHGREQVHHIELAADGDGRLLAVRDRIVHNAGAYNALGLVVPHNSLTHLTGPYRVEALDVSMRVVLTNTGITAPYRGAGRPEAVFAMERAMDRLARAAELDPVELRARNLIGPDELPFATGIVYRDGKEQVFDSGDWPALLEGARAAIEAEPWRARASERRAIGIGYAAYTEGTGVGPFESARATLLTDGRVRVASGTSTQGQGHRTTLAQIAADALGAELAEIEIVSGDTAAIATGFGTIASRSIVVGGNAVHEAATALREQLLGAAAALLDRDAAALTLERGAIRGASEPLLTLAELAGALSPYNPGRPAGLPAQLSAEVVYRPPTVTWAAGVHAAVVAVDVPTGVVEILRYVVAHDCGRPVNPTIVDGQVRGGVLQGIGGALYEELVYDETGQLRTGSFMDYLLPTAGEAPDVQMVHFDVPSPLNALGVKGLGEGGAIGPGAALANAVEDALAELGVVVRRGPLSPSRVRALIRESTELKVRAS
jgi:aerobic carbon-monoxide dehydrogenase large subunit